MSVHNTCGEEIRWADRDAHHAHPPLEYIGNAYIVGSDNIVRNVPTYKIHVCDPAKVEEWTQHRTEAKAQREAYEMSREEFNEIAMRRPCPRCHVDIGVMCVNLTVLARRSEAVPVRWCHAERGPVNTAPDPEEL